jgi:signal transduction histidine kinase
MRARLLSLLLRTSPPQTLGLVVAAVLIAVETLGLYPLTGDAQEGARGVIYLLGVLVVSTVWGAFLGVVTSLASAIAFNYFHVLPYRMLDLTPIQDLREVGIFVAAALVVSGLANLARSRAVEAYERHQEADLAAGLAQLMLGSDDVRSVLGAASARLAEAFDLRSAAIELEAVGRGEQRTAFPLFAGGTCLGTLLVPAGVPEPTLVRLRHRVVPSLEALLRAASEREAITNALKESREEFSTLMEEQAALRRVATLVARGGPPTEVFNAVTDELGRILGLYSTALIRYEPDGTAICVSGRNDLGSETPAGMRISLEGDTVMGAVRRTGRAARIDSYANAAGPSPAIVRGRGIRSGVGVPVLVEGRIWGVAVVVSAMPEPIPSDTETRMANFTELVATAIANADSRTQLTTSRARIVATADDARRRLERDLHDGAQQRLVSLGLELRMVEASVPPELDPIRAQLSHAVNGLTGVFEDLQRISRGIHPAILSQGGLGPAIRTLARRSAVPVELNLDIGRLPNESVQVAVYYIVSEALTNAAKHARASIVHVEVEMGATILRLSIRDDGIGGADLSHGSGLIGLQDRIETLGGHMEIVSPAGSGTALLVKIPIDGARTAAVQPIPIAQQSRMSMTEREPEMRQ